MDGGRALASLLDGARLLSPSGLPALARDSAVSLGATEVRIFLANHEQTELVPLDGAAGRLDIGATLAGRCFQHIELLHADEGHRVWVPLLDGTDRIGVLEVDVPSDATVPDRDLIRLATLLAELVVSKGAYGDVIELTRRSQPMTLPAELQRSLLPPGTFSTDHVVVSGMLEPSYQIAGDAYDFAASQELLHLALFDAMGHGLDATLMAAVAISAYRNARRRRQALEATLAEVDAALADDAVEGRFVTAVLAELNLLTGRLEWVSAGHLPPLLVRQGKVVRRLEADPWLPLGLGGAAGERGSIGLEPGDRLLLLTDGVVEARSVTGVVFGEQRLVELIERAASAGLPVPETIRRVRRSMLEHHDHQLQDDATLLFVEWRPTDIAGLLP